jgi:hypothetical protein
MAEWIWDNWIAVMLAVYALCGLIVLWAAWPR